MSLSRLVDVFLAIGPKVGSRGNTVELTIDDVSYQNARTLTHAAIRRVGFHPTAPSRPAPSRKVKGMMG